MFSQARATIEAAKPSLVRYKRTQKLAPGATRIVNLLSVISAHKKQPKRLNYTVEDKLRHEVVESAWRLHKRDERAQQTQKLKAQYESIREACAELKALDEGLYTKATAREVGKRFSMELRVPTDTPPTKVWDFDWTPEQRAAKA